MVIKFTLSVPLESIKDCARKLSELPLLPDYITQEGPYINNRKEETHQIIIIYKFNKWKFPGAQEIICKQLGSLNGLPEFTLSAHIYGPRPYHLILANGQEVKHDPIP